MAHCPARPPWPRSHDFETLVSTPRAGRPRAWLGQGRSSAMSTTTYPVHVDAELDPRLSRWLWLFKWLLVIPHYIVLAFLWLAFVVLSVVAFFGILFTGRYPHSIFEFNV